MAKIIRSIAEFIDDHTSGITYLITFLATVKTAKSWVDMNHAVGLHAFALVALVFFFICPIFFFVFTVLMLIPKAICHIGLQIYYASAGLDSWGFSSEDYKKAEAKRKAAEEKENEKKAKRNKKGNTDSNKKENTNSNRKENSNSGRKENTGDSSSGNSRSNGDDGSNRNSGSSSGTGQTGNAYTDALNYFGLTIPFTEAELKSKYRQAIKKAHPDQGGSKEEAERINAYYTTLKGKWS